MSVEAATAAMKDLTIVEGTDGGNASLELLARLGVSYTNYSHDVATTVEEQFKHVGHLPGGLTKNLLLRVRRMSKPCTPYSLGAGRQVPTIGLEGLLCSLDVVGCSLVFNQKDRAETDGGQTWPDSF